MMDIPPIKTKKVVDRKDERWYYVYCCENSRQESRVSTLT